MKKTLLFTLDFPPDFGGVASYYREICGNLLNDRIVVLTLKRKNKKDSEFPYKIYRRNLITALPIWPKSVFSFWHLWRVIRKEKIKTVLVGQILPLGSITLFLSKVLKFDYGVFIHGLDILNAQKKIKNKVLAQKVLKKAKFVVANSKFTAEELKKFGVNSEKITIVYPCPFNKPPAKESVKQELIKKYNLEDKRIILSLGRLVKRKGFDKTIKVMPKVVQEEKNTLYIIAGGKGSYEKEIKEIIEGSPVKENIILIQNSSNDEVKALLDLCDIFVMPSRQINEDVEGFGIVFLEANLFNKPVIGGRSGGVIEAIVHERTGFLVDPINEQEISEKIIKLLKDKELRRKIGEEGRRRVEQEFTWNKQVEKIKDLL